LLIIHFVFLPVLHVHSYSTDTVDVDSRDDEGR